MPLADTLLRLASDPRLYLPKWTDHIMAEVSRNLQENFGLTAEQAAYRESEIRKHFGEAWVEGYEDLIPSMTNQEKDRHVLAGAVRCGAETIVTYNLRDFQRPALAPYSITARGGRRLVEPDNKLNVFQPLLKCPSPSSTVTTPCMVFTA